MRHPVHCALLGVRAPGQDQISDHYGLVAAVGVSSTRGMGGRMPNARQDMPEAEPSGAAAWQVVYIKPLLSGPGCVMLVDVDVDESQHAFGGIVL